MTQLRRKDRIYKRRYFIIGVVLTSAALLLAGVLGPLFVGAGADPRPLMAALPFIYVPVLLLGVGWLLWTTLAPRRDDGKR
jgi:hypothetical protein